MNIEQRLKESIQVKQEFLSQVEPINRAAELIIEAFHQGHKLMLCGNGGSAADSQHISAELLGRFDKERKALPAMTLTADTSFITAWSNDYEYETVFSRQVEAFAKTGDILFCISTSGNSKSVLRAAQAAQKLGCKVISLSGGQGGELKALSEVSIIAPSPVTARIQECHITAYHAICEQIDEEFSDP